MRLLQEIERHQKRRKNFKQANATHEYYYLIPNNIKTGEPVKSW